MPTTALDASTYTMEVTYAQSFSQPTDAGADPRGDDHRMGNIVGSLANPLLISATLSQSVDESDPGPLNDDTMITLTATG